jgi:hypothetical protein
VTCAGLPTRSTQWQWNPRSKPIKLSCARSAVGPARVRSSLAQPLSQVLCPVAIAAGASDRARAVEHASQHACARRVPKVSPSVFFKAAVGSFPSNCGGADPAIHLPSFAHFPALRCDPRSVPEHARSVLIKTRTKKGRVNRTQNRRRNLPHPKKGGNFFFFFKKLAFFRMRFLSSGSPSWMQR